MTFDLKYNNGMNADWGTRRFAASTPAGYSKRQPALRGEVVKSGVQGVDVESWLRVASESGWALCIGAGTSLPAFPSWPALVELLISGIHPRVASSLTKSLLGKWSPDAIIQAVREIRGIADSEFAVELAQHLYRKGVKSALDLFE